MKRLIVLFTLCLSITSTIYGQVPITLDRQELKKKKSSGHDETSQSAKSSRSKSSHKSIGPSNSRKSQLSDTAPSIATPQRDTRTQSKVRFKCNAPHYQLYINKRYVDATQSYITLQRGYHDITAKADGYLPWSKKIYVDNEEEVVVISLDPGRTEHAHLTLSDGSSYDGNAHLGKPHGEGKQTFRDGSTYSGFWVNGKKQGHGTYSLKDGSKYIGEYYDDKPTKGKWEYANGTILHGSYDAAGNWKTSENSIQSLAIDKAIYIGRLRYNSPIGKGSILYRNGDSFRGIWAQHIYSSTGTEYNVSCLGYGTYTSSNDATRKLNNKQGYVDGTGQFKEKNKYSERLYKQYLQESR